MSASVLNQAHAKLDQEFKDKLIAKAMFVIRARVNLRNQRDDISERIDECDDFLTTLDSGQDVDISKLTTSYNKQHTN